MNKRGVDVHVHEGKLIGIVEECVDGGNYTAFRGIPYAKPPVNELRFRVGIYSILQSNINSNMWLLILTLVSTRIDIK